MKPFTCAMLSANRVCILWLTWGQSVATRKYFRKVDNVICNCCSGPAGYSDSYFGAAVPCRTTRAPRNFSEKPISMVQYIPLVSHNGCKTEKLIANKKNVLIPMENETEPNIVQS